MIKRTIHFSRESRLSLRNCQMLVHFTDDDSERTIPIEDIGFVVLENRRITVTIPLIAALAENNVTVVFCDNHSMPTSMLMNLDGNSIQGEVSSAQLEASLPLKKQLWKQIVESKIRNQAALLDSKGKDGRRLLYYADNVKSGDSDNREGAAARIYWQELFGGSFTRDRFGGPPNNLLNYGYSILRAATARALTGSGMMPIQGLFHKNRYNAFPLADDMMEPFRPFVDDIVYELYNVGETELTKDVKVHLLEALTCDVRFSDCLRPLEVGLSFTTASLARCFAKESRKLELPLM